MKPPIYNNNLGGKSILAIVLVSLLLLSPYTLVLFTIKGVYYFEFAIAITISLMIFLKSKVGIIIQHSFRESLSIIVVAVLAIAGFSAIGYANYSDMVSSYTDFRANLFLIIGFTIFGSILRRSVESILMFCACTTGFSVLHWLHYYILGDSFVKYPAPILASILGGIIAVKAGRIIYSLFFVFGVLFLASVSGFRQYWLMATFALVFIIHSMLSNVKEKFRMVMLFVVIFGISVPFVVDFLFFYLSSDESRYIQSIGKGLDLIKFLRGDGVSDSDNLRLSYFQYMIDEWWALILPHGLGYKAIGNQIDPWFYRVSTESSVLDSAILYVVYQYGYIIFIPMIIYLIAGVIKSHRSRSSYEGITLLAIFLITVLFDGGQLTVVHRAFWLGAFCCYLVAFRNASQGPGNVYNR